MRAFRSLQRQGDFARMYRRGKRFSASGFVLYAAPAPRGRQVSKIGVSVSKAVGKAVYRNLVRRRVQCAFDNIGPQVYENLDLLVVAKPGAGDATFSRLIEDLKTALIAVRRSL